MPEKYAPVKFLPPIHAVWLDRPGIVANSKTGYGKRWNLHRWDDGETLLQLIEGDGRREGFMVHKDFQLGRTSSWESAVEEALKRIAQYRASTPKPLDQPKIQKYVVSSVSTNSPQTFLDVVFAASGANAIAKIAKLRPYAELFESYTVPEMEDLVNNIKCMTKAEVMKELKDLEAELT